MINDFQEKLKYKPTKIAYHEITLETSGYFGFMDQTGDNCESTELLMATVESIIDYEKIFK